MSDSEGLGTVNMVESKLTSSTIASVSPLPSPEEPYKPDSHVATPADNVSALHGLEV